MTVSQISSMLDTLRSSAKTKDAGVLEYMESNSFLTHWLADAVQSTDPFETEITMKACDVAVATDLLIVKSAEVSIGLLETFMQYPEECKPHVIKLLASLIPKLTLKFANLLLSCSLPEESELLRSSVVEVINIDLDFLNQLDNFENASEVTMIRSTIWACITALMFDDCPDIRKIACEKLSLQILSEKNRNASNGNASSDISVLKIDFESEKKLVK